MNTCSVSPDANMPMKRCKDEGCHDDPVIREIPVFLSQPTGDEVWVLQYPARPACRPYSRSNTTASNAQVKPQQKQLRLQMHLDTCSSSYDSSRGEQFALNVDGAGGHESAPRYPSGRMDTHELIGRSVGIDSTRLCVGSLVCDDNEALGESVHGENLELHLTPVSSVLAMRPHFDYLDTCDTRARSEARARGETSEGSSTNSTNVEPAIERVSVKFAKSLNDKQQAALDNSYQSVKQREMAEPWLPARFHATGSSTTKAHQNRLRCAQTSDNDDDSRLFSTTVSSISVENYRRQLVPESESTEAVNTTAASVTPSSSQPPKIESSLRQERQLTDIPLCQLRKLPPCDQLRALMLRQQLCRLQCLMSQLSSTAALSIDDAVRQLQQCCRLVDGVWVVRSELLFPPSDRRLDARDLLLFWFTQGRVITRKQWTETTRIDADTALQLIEPLARCDRSNGWSLKFKADTHMERVYPEVVQRQKALWEARHAQLVRLFAGHEAKPLAPVLVSAVSTPAAKTRKRRRLTSLRRDSTSGSDVESPHRVSDCTSSLLTPADSSVRVKTEPVSEVMS